MKNVKFLKVFLRVVASIILLQTLYFKFSASEESVYIFTTVGMEPLGRIGVGIAELICAALLLYKPSTAVGALVGLGLMTGAIGLHATSLGLEVQEDGGYLFFLASTVWLCCAFLLYVERNFWIDVYKKWKGNY